MPSAAFTRLRDLEQAELDRRVGAEHLAGGDAEQQRVADLAGGAGDGDVDGRSVHWFISSITASANSRRADRGGVVSGGLEVVGDLLALCGSPRRSPSPCGRRPRARRGGASISTPDSISAVGFTLFWPLYFGAEPWVASNIAASVPMFAPGARPRPPIMPGAEVGHDVAVEVGQHDHVVLLGPRHELVAQVVDDPVLELDVAVVLARPRARPRGRARRRTS